MTLELNLAAICEAVEAAECALEVARAVGDEVSELRAMDALGVALFIWHQLLDNPRTRKPGESDSQSGSLLRPAASQ